MARKIVQIAVLPDASDPEGASRPRLLALAADGTLWSGALGSTFSGWEALPPLPDEVESAPGPILPEEPAAPAEVAEHPNEQEPPIAAAPAEVAARPQEHEYHPVAAAPLHDAMTLDHLKISDLLVGHWLQLCIKPDVSDVPLRPLIEADEEIANLLRVCALAVETEKDRAVLLAALGESEAVALAVLQASDPDYGALAATGRHILRDTLLGHLPMSLRHGVPAP